MTTISKAIQQSTSKCALIPFITAGDPSYKFTLETIKTLGSSGAEVIELGLPYSVPLADGPTIQDSSCRALRRNINLDKILDLVEQVSYNINSPIVLFTYYNPILSRGILTFIQNISRSGIKGLLIPDLPLEESDYILYLCHQFSIELIFLISPSSDLFRVENILKKAFGCIYLVSKTGVTGTDFNTKLKIEDLVVKIKKLTYKPLIVGFGISSLQHVSSLSKLNINGLVLGSIFVQKMLNHDLQEIIKFCQDIKFITCKH